MFSFSFPPIHLWGWVRKGGWIFASLPPHGHHPRRVCELGLNFLFLSCLSFSFSNCPATYPPISTSDISTLGGCMWLLLSLSVVYLSFSVPLSHPLLFSPHWHVSLVERVKECNPYWNGLWWRQSCQEAGLPCCCSSGSLSLFLPVKKVVILSLGFCEPPPATWWCLSPCLAFSTHFPRMLLIEVSV